MKLTKKEKDMLEGKYGKSVKKSMEVLVKLGEVYGADHMVEIQKVHSPGVSYRVTGNAGLNYVKEASEEGHFCVPATLNTVGIDTKQWEEVGFDKEFSEKQLELIDAYKKLGAVPVNSCTPYLVGSLPMFGEHVAWGESSAISFVNSVIGARTNREGGPTALAAALTGRVPAYGYHLDENRRGTCLINVDVDLKTDKDFAVLGYFAGKVAGKGVPVIDGIKERPSIDNFKALSAAVASSGAVALYHVVGFTPEAPTKEAIIDDMEPIKFGQKEYNEVCNKFSVKGKIDFVVIGCPHVSINEFREMSELLKDKKLKSDLWICTSRQVKELADVSGYIENIINAGAEIICDTCPVLCCTLDRGYKTIATDSCKMAHYAPGLWNLQPLLLSKEDCVKAAIAGRWEE